MQKDTKSKGEAGAIFRRRYSKEQGYNFEGKKKRQNSQKEEVNTKKDQANKSTGWMPRHLQPKKDAVSCEKPWGAASERRSMDVRMGKPGGGNAPSPVPEHIGH